MLKDRKPQLQIADIGRVLEKGIQELKLTEIGRMLKEG